MATRRVGWSAAATQVVLLGAVPVGMIALFVRMGMARASDLAQILALMLSYMALVWSLAWNRRRPGNDTLSVEGLRRAVRWQSAEEIGRQQQLCPPLRLQLRSTSHAVVPSSPVAGGSHGSMTAPLVLNDDEVHPARALVEAFRDDPRPWVILGEEKTGKTTLALLFTSAMAHAASDQPVPVLLSAAGWNPARQRIEEWVTQRVLENYPDLADRSTAAMDAVTRLIKDHRIMPVLDDLDEMPDNLLGAAISDVNRATSTGLPIMLTCRSDKYKCGVAQAGPLLRAAVMDIEPVQSSDIKRFLAQRVVADSTRWQSVLEETRRSPGPVTSVLSLLLLKQSPMRVDPILRDSAKSRWWLAFLATYLHDRIRVANLRWEALSVALRNLGALILIAPVVVCAATALVLLELFLLSRIIPILVDLVWMGVGRGLGI